MMAEPLTVLLFAAAPGHSPVVQCCQHSSPTAAPALCWHFYCCRSSHHCIFALLECWLALLQECSHALALIRGAKAAVEQLPAGQHTAGQGQQPSRAEPCTCTQVRVVCLGMLDMWLAHAMLPEQLHHRPDQLQHSAFPHSAAPSRSPPPPRSLSLPPQTGVMFNHAVGARCITDPPFQLQPLVQG